MPDEESVIARNDMLRREENFCRRIQRIELGSTSSVLYLSNQCGTSTHMFSESLPQRGVIKLLLSVVITRITWMKPNLPILVKNEYTGTWIQVNREVDQLK